jgi:hypothetical protein
MGGVRNANQRFCNNRCAQNAYTLNASQNIPQADIERRVEEVWRGNCPKCGGLGPVDVHKFHQVWSALVLTRSTSNQQVSCRSCGTKRQLGAALMSLVFGWWGFPWGLVLTPVQITRNIVGMASGPGSSQASAELRRLVHVHMGSQILAANQQRSSAVPPLPPK